MFSLMYIIGLESFWHGRKVKSEDKRVEVTLSSKGRTGAEAGRRISSHTAAKRPYSRMNGHVVPNKVSIMNTITLDIRTSRYGRGGFISSQEQFDILLL
jgi:hypothetical protein